MTPTLVVAMRDGPCDLPGPHDDMARGKNVEARSVLTKIRAAGGSELHICFPCRRAVMAAELAERA